MTIGQDIGQSPPSFSYNVVVKHSALDFANESDFKSHVLNHILSATRYQELVYTSVSPHWGARLAQFLDEASEGRPARKSYNSSSGVFRVRVMPTELHDCLQEWFGDQKSRWLLSGQLTLAESDHLRARVGTTMVFLQPPYAGSRKEPDLFIRPDSAQFPTVVIESGWSETATELQNDMNLWLVGEGGAVNAALLLKWVRLPNSNQVRGAVRLYTLDNQGMPALCQTEDIFPAPPPGAPTQRIRLSRRHFFGSALSQFPGRNAADDFSLDLNLLRSAAVSALNRMGLTPV